MDVYQRRRLVALSSIVGVFVIVVLIVSGGDDEQDVAPVTAVTGPTGVQELQPLAKGEYIEQADAICAEANSSLEAIEAADLVQAARSEARIMATQLRGLRELPPPRRDRDVAADFLRALRLHVDALRDRRVALERDDGAALVEIDSRIAQADAEAQEAATEFGFEVCGNPDAGPTVGPETAEPVPPAEPSPAEVAPAEPAPAPADPAPAQPAPDTGGVAPGDTGGVSP